MTLDNLPLYCSALLSAKSTSGLTFSQIAEQLQKPEVWTTALFFGQTKADEATAKALLRILDAENYVELVTHEGDKRTLSALLLTRGLKGEAITGGGMVVRGGTWEWPPKDPVLYRLYEVLVVYGWSYKALIAEKFGDGIMSAIGFRTSVEKKTDANGDRVVITMDGKWLPYSETDQWDMSLSK